MATEYTDNWEILNPSFETTDTEDWTILSTSGAAGASSVTSEQAYSGVYSFKWIGVSGSSAGQIVLLNDARANVNQGKSIQATCAIKMNDTNNSANRGEVRLYWLDANQNVISYSPGNTIRGNSSAWLLSTVTATAPAGAVYAALGVWLQSNASGGIHADYFTWNYTYNNTAVIENPAYGDSFAPGETITLEVNSATGDTENTATSATYRIYTVVEGEDIDDYPLYQTVEVSNGTTGYVTIDTESDYYIVADVFFSDQTYITTSGNVFTIAEVEVETREYAASNSQTYLIGRNINDLASSMPDVALVTGVEVLVDYMADIVGRVKTKNVEVTTATSANPDGLFTVVPGGIIEIALLSLDSSSGAYTRVGEVLTQSITFTKTDYTISEQKLSEDKLYTYWADAQHTTTIGGEEALFGISDIDGSTFRQRAIGIRFYPTTGTVPVSYDAGDACVRFKIDRLKIKVYFNAGSIEYYFASADRTQVIKGELVSSNVDDGDFTNNDASGSLQLRPGIEVVEGTQTYIGDDWTIHSQYPVTDDNQIGEVADRVQADGVGMAYNALPGYWEVEDNRSRYEFISANFYGDPDWDSIYGVNGCDRAFSYNGEDFYKIQTQPDINKDKPRHLAYHYVHLALGYKEGRVDISVVGEPYNFDGVDGASSWATGDSVIGLTALSGTILGVFCSKSIQGISGTTVDNFAQQTLAPNVGAIEYTISDMGFPVYANAYGIYTLSQTSQYGDYLGSPLSQAISPWLRPRLVRKTTSKKEVVCAWPVRSKNQYRLAFADGYVLTMTMNFGNQTAQTFSKQKYFIQEDYVDTSWSYEDACLVPAAVSSELDDAGQERIHIANKYTAPAQELPAVGGLRLGVLTYASTDGNNYADMDLYIGDEADEAYLDGQIIFDDQYHAAVGQPLNVGTTDVRLVTTVHVTLSAGAIQTLDHVLLVVNTSSLGENVAVTSTNAEVIDLSSAAGTGYVALRVPLNEALIGEGVPGQTSQEETFENHTINAVVTLEDGSVLNYVFNVQADTINQVTSPSGSIVGPITPTSGASLYYSSDYNELPVEQFPGTVSWAEDGTISVSIEQDAPWEALGTIGLKSIPSTAVGNKINIDIYSVNLILEDEAEVGGIYTFSVDSYTSASEYGEGNLSVEGTISSSHTINNITPSSGNLVLIGTSTEYTYVSSEMIALGLPSSPLIKAGSSLAFTISVVENS